MTPIRVTDLPALETREDFLNYAIRLRTIAVHNHTAAPGWNAKYDVYSKQKQLTKREIDKDLQSNLQFLDAMCKQAGHGSIFAEEAPIAYKNVSHVIEVVHNAQLAKKVAKLEPLAVIKVG